MMDKTQNYQEEEYSIPYHHIPSFSKDFKQSFSWSWGFCYSATIEFLIKEIREISIDKHKILDLGTGDGRLAKEIKKAFKKNEVHGYDYSKRAIDLAKCFSKNVKYKNYDVINENIKDKFDIITLIEVFEHIKPELCEKFAKSTYNLLNKNAHLLITVPHINKKLQDKHYQHFTLKKLRKYFPDSKYKLKEVKYIEKKGVKKAIISLILHNNLFTMENRSIRNFLYKYYKKNLFLTNEENCSRIYLHLIKK